MADGEIKRIGDYVDEWRSIGERFRERHRHAFLLRREDDAVEEEDPSFHTAFMRRDQLGLGEKGGATLAPKTARPTEHPKLHGVGEVLEIEKRLGSPFQERIGVGRARNADVCVLLPKVSKYHAFFTKTGDDAYSLTDAGSKNGTFVEGRKLDEKEPTPLESGSEVCFGPYRFTFYSAGGFASMVARRAALR